MCVAAFGISPESGGVIVIRFRGSRTAAPAVDPHVSSHNHLTNARHNMCRTIRLFTYVHGILF